MTGFSDKKFGLIGKNLEHSYSVPIHKMLADYDYRLYPTSPENLGNVIEEAELDGFNVTIPYKQSIFGLCDSVSSAAKEIGAVNTVRITSNGGIYGYNTDVFGFEYTLDSMNLDVEGKKVLVLGNGGASKAVCYVLKQRNAIYKVISRKGEDNYTNIYENSDTEIIVNATPVGMYPKTDGKLIELARFPDLCAVIDLIYNPMRTPLLAEAEKLGISHMNGLPMLVAQAKNSAELFTGKKIDNEVIDEIVAALQSACRNIVLIGMPGCGKTSVGKLLAEKLDMEFCDTDDLIAETTGKTPEYIIINKGEKYFRKKETEMLKTVCREKGRIIASGGGAVTTPKNLDIMRQNGLVIYIKRDTEKLVADHRPLSADLKKLYSERKILYENFADITVDGNGSIEKTVALIEEQL